MLSLARTLERVLVKSNIFRAAYSTTIFQVVQPSSANSLGERHRLYQNKSLRPQHELQSRRFASASHVENISSTVFHSKGDEYGSQATPLRVPTHARDLVKVALLGAAGGIGQPLSLMMMLHTNYINHLALFDLSESLQGVGLDLGHCQMKVTTHLGPNQIAEAVKGARVIVIAAGLAQRPGMSRDDLFGPNSKIMYDLAKSCAQHAPDAMLAIVSNPVNSLVPITCELYAKMLGSGKSQPKSQSNAMAIAADHATEAASDQTLPGAGQAAAKSTKQSQFEDCFRRIFGVTTLDVVRASTLTAKSTLFKKEPNGLFKDPSKITVPVVGGHAGKTIMPLLSQASPKLDRERLVEDKTTTLKLVESIQQAGIDVLNAKKGSGSATLAMAYSACRFTLSLLRAQAGEQNVVECAYVRHATPPYGDMEYFATPLLLGKDGYVKPVAPYLAGGTGSHGSGTGQAASSSPSAGTSASGSSKLLAYEQQMLEEGSRELRLSIVKGEDFAREQLSSETMP